MKSDNYPKLVAIYNDKSTDEIKLIEEIVSEGNLKAFDIYKVALCIDDFCKIQYENVVSIISLTFILIVFCLDIREGQLGSIQKL